MSDRWKNGRFKDEAHKQAVYEANKASYRRHADKYRVRTGRRNAELKLKALKAHGAMKCQRCGFDKHPAALEFHHRDPQVKVFNVSAAVTAPKKYPWPLILAELAKCDVICANCHKIEHCDRLYPDNWRE